jgi:hypothetical protein
MTERELTRMPNDRRLYSLEGVGTVRLEGLFSRRGSAEADGRRWSFSRRGFWQRVIEATDEGGAVVGEFVPRDIRRGGAIQWEGRELTLRPVSSLRERYVLGEADRELALLDGKGWGRRPVEITLPEPGAIEPGLLLFTAFVVHQLASEANGSVAASTAATTGSYSGS